MSPLQRGSIIAVLMVIGSLGLVIWAKLNGMASHDLSTRAIMVIIGLMNVGYSNAIPKQGKPVSGRLLSIKRFTGWSMTLGGLAFTVVWIFAPMSYAAELSIGAVLASIAVVFAYCLANNRPKPGPRIEGA